SGAKVDCWATVGVALLGFWISYQRMPELRLTGSATTEWLTTSDSWSPKFRYASRYMRRSPNESMRLGVLAWGTQPLTPGQKGVNGATWILVGPVNVEFAGVAKSTWNL